MNKKMKRLAVICMAVLACSVAVAQTVHTVYIDPMSNNGPTNWNNISFGVSNNAALLRDSLTNATGIRATVTVPLNTGANANASLSPSGSAAEFLPAGANSAYGHIVAWNGTPAIPYSEVVFSNLNTTVAYSFTFYASRTGVSDIRDARYTATGSNSVSVVLDAANNSSQVVTATNVYPSSVGTITVRIEKGPNNTTPTYFFYYLTAMKFVYTEPPPIMLYVDAAGSSTATGWNLLRMNDYSDTVLLETNGVSSGIRAQVTTPFSGYSATFSTPAPSGFAAEFKPAGADVCYTAPAAGGYLKLYFLKPALGYTFTFYASRVGSAGTDTRQTFYTVTGANSVSNNLEAANNTQNVAIVSNVFPASDGTLTVRLSAGLTNNQNNIYLTAFKISYTDDGIPTPSLADITGKRLLFFGNQYTSAENVPNLVAGLAEIGGYARPFVLSDLANNRTLADQIARVDSYPGFNVNHPTLTGTNTWDHVIIQGHGDESSSLGDVTAFRTNALALYRKVKNHATGAGAGAVLFQTWARGTGSAVYPDSFATPATMQAEIDGNTAIASNNIAVAEGAGSVRLAPAGDAFATGAFDAARLYAANLSDPAAAGPELAALVLYKTLYGGTATNLSYDAAITAGLTTMTESDWVRVTHWAEGLVAPEPQAPAAGDRRVILLDACANAAGSQIYLGWNYLSFHTAGSVQLVLTNGYATPVTCEVLTRMNATTTTSAANPTGDAAIFARALANNAYGNINPFGSYSNEYCVARFSGLNTLSTYTFTFYASRTGATGRDTLYLLEGGNNGSATLDAGNNSTQVAVIKKIRPKTDGTIDLKITAGPNNTSAEKFYHINALMIESTRSGLVIMMN